jgi:hypothetical protein
VENVNVCNHSERKAFLVSIVVVGVDDISEEDIETEKRFVWR